GKHFVEIKQLADAQIKARDDEQTQVALQKMGEITDKRRRAQDFAGLITARIRNDQQQTAERIANTRQWLMMAILFFGAGIIAASAMATWRVEQTLKESISRQGRRTEAIVGGMA